METIYDLKSLLTIKYLLQLYRRMYNFKHSFFVYKSSLPEQKDISLNITYFQNIIYRESRRNSSTKQKVSSGMCSGYRLKREVSRER